MIPLTKNAIGTDISHSFSRRENTFTIGTQHALDPLTTVKGRLKNYGRAVALLQHEWRPKSFVTFSGEVDTKSLHKSAVISDFESLKDLSKFDWNI